MCQHLIKPMPDDISIEAVSRSLGETVIEQIDMRDQENREAVLRLPRWLAWELAKSAFHIGNPDPYALLLSLPEDDLDLILLMNREDPLVEAETELGSVEHVCLSRDAARWSPS